MPSSIEAKIAELRPAPRETQARVEDKTPPELELMLTRANMILSNKLLLAKLDDRGAKLTLKVTHIEAELTKRRQCSNTPSTNHKTSNNQGKRNIKDDVESTEYGQDDKSVTKLRGRQCSNTPSTNHKTSNNQGKRNIKDDVESTEYGQDDKSVTKLRGRYDECLVPAPNLYSKLKSMSISDSILHTHLAHIQIERLKEISKTSDGCPVDVTKNLHLKL